MKAIPAAWLTCSALLFCWGQLEKAAGQMDQALVWQIREMIRSTRGENGTVDLSLLLRRYLPDPLPVPDFNISDSGTFSSLEGSFRNVQLSGLSGVEIRQIRLNLAHNHLMARAQFPLLGLDGEYDLTGSVTFFTVFGAGNMWMNASGVDLNGSIFVQPDPALGHMKVESAKVRAHAEDTKLHFDNLGGALISSVTNALLNQMSSLLFRHVERLLLADLERNLKEELNRQLAHVPVELESGTGSSNPFDRVLRKAADSFRLMGLDPLPLADHSYQLDQRLPAIGGGARVSNGTLLGLSTLRRTGDVVLIYDKDGVSARAGLGFSNLTGGYDWTLNLMGFHLAGRSSLSVRSVSATLVLRQSLQTGDRPRVTELKVDRIRQVWVELEGLGVWDPAARVLINLMANWLKLSLARAVSEEVRAAIQEQLDRLSLSLF